MPATAHRAYDTFDVPDARQALDAHYGMANGVYKLWGSPPSVLTAVLRGWEGSDHPAQLHYGWNFESARNLDAAIRETTLRVYGELTRGEEQPLRRVLEAGCGVGGAVTQLARAVPQTQFVGVSIVSRQMEIARRRAISQGLGNARFVTANFLALPFPDGSFDGAYAIEALCHCPEPDRGVLMGELFRVLRPGGRVSVVDGYLRRDPASDRERRCLQDVLDGWTLPTPCRPGAFSDLARQAGFDVSAEAEFTPNVLSASRRIRDIGRWVLTPLAGLAALPGVPRVLAPIGFGSAAGGRRFAAACRSQYELLRSGFGGYWQHVFIKPVGIR